MPSRPRLNRGQLGARAKTIPVKRITRADLAAGRLAYPPVEGIDRPKTREECREQREREAAKKRKRGAR